MKSIKLSLALMLFLVGVCYSTFSQAGFLYVLNDSTAGNTIYGFSVDESTGSLVALPGFPVSTGGLGGDNTRSEELFFDRANARLFAINVGSSTVAAFTVNPTTGALTALPYSPIVMPNPPPGSWACLSVHPSGSPLVVGDRDNFRVASFNVTSTSATLINTASTSSGTNLANAFSCVFSRDGNYFYTGGNSTTYDKFAGFSVDPSTGALSSLNGSPFFAGGYTPEAYVTDAQGRLFVTTNGIPSYTLAYTTSSGIPTRINLPNFLSGLTVGVHGVLHPLGFYIVADRHGNRIGVYAIAGSGASTTITPVTGSPFASGGSFTDVLALNQSGDFLFAANGNSRNISVFSVNSGTGALTSTLVQPNNTIGAAGRIVGMAYAPPGSEQTPPDAPTAVVVTALPGRMQVSFTAPVSNGGSNITTYTASCTAAGYTTRSNTGGVSPISVYGLSPGVSYACSVTASNVIGTSVASASVTTTARPVDLTPILMLLLD